jgi:hypothetical protein
MKYMFLHTSVVYYNIIKKKYKFLEIGSNILFTKPWNIDGELVNLKGITKNS